MMTRRLFIQLAAALTLLVLLIQAAWAVSMPGFRGPDEPHHVNSILRLSSGGGWPAPGDAMLEASIIEAGKEAGMIVPGAQDFVGAARTRLAIDAAAEAGRPPFRTPFRDADVVPHEKRSVISLGTDGVEVDQMTQHPPLYYAGGAAVVVIFDLDEQPWDRLLLGLRLYGILLTLPLVPSLIYSARKLGASRPWALTAGFMPLLVPQYMAITGGVTNDSLAVGLGSLVVASLVKAGVDRISWRTIALVGGSLGLALWSKGLLLAFGLALILVFALKADETWRARIVAILASGTGALLLGWWWLVNIVRYGVIQPSGFVRTVPDDWDPSMAEFPVFLSSASRTLSTSFFSAFGWLEVDFPSPVTTILTVAVIAALGWAVLSTREHRRTILAILAAAAGTVLLILAESWSTYRDFGIIAGVQGRYLFPFLAVLGFAVLGLARFGSRAIVITAAAALAVGGYGLMFFLSTAYPAESLIDFPRFSLVAGISEPALGVMMGAVGAALIGALALAVYISTKESQVSDDSTPVES